MIRKSFALALIGGFVLAIGATTANAGWWHHGGYGSSGGSSGSWGGSSGYSSHYYGSSGGWASSGGSSGYWGSSGGSSGGYRHHGLFGHKHRGWGGSSGSSGYSTYYYGSSGGSSGYSSFSYGSSGGSSGGSYGGYYSSGYGSSYGSQGGVISGNVIYGAPTTTAPANATPPMPTPPPLPANPGAAPAAPGAPAVAPPGTGASYSPVENGTAAIISVNVPATAKVFVNGNATTSTGTARQYISRGLRAGQLYTYEFRLEAEINGQVVTETKLIQVTGGQRAELAFNTTTDATVVGQVEKPASNKTTLILNVPADAKVTLGGAETQQTGPVREFSTDKLAAGDKWENYTIRVEARVDGEVRVAEKTVTVNAGDTRELSFNEFAPVITRTASR